MIKRQQFFATLQAKTKGLRLKALIGGALTVVLLAMILLTVVGVSIFRGLRLIAALCEEYTEQFIDVLDQASLKLDRWADE